MEFRVRSIVIRVFLLACLGCGPQRELSSHGEGAAPELDPAAKSGSQMTPPPDVEAAASCAPMGGFTIPAMGSCYMLGDNVFTWQDARSFCQAWGGDLVEIDSFEENVALARRIDGSVWIG